MRERKRVREREREKRNQGREGRGCLFRSRTDREGKEEKEGEISLPQWEGKIGGWRSLSIKGYPGNRADQIIIITYEHHSLSNHYRYF